MICFLNSVCEVLSVLYLVTLIVFAAGFLAYLLWHLFFGRYD